MTDGMRQALAVLLGVLAVGGWLGVEVWRGRSQEHSARVLRLHLGAPLLAIVLCAIAIWLLLGTQAIRRAQERVPGSPMRRTGVPSAHSPGPRPGREDGRVSRPFK